MSGSVVTPTFPAATQVAGCAGAACVDVETDITAEDDAALLADMQGFASALGCDWQVRLPTICTASVKDDSQIDVSQGAFPCQLSGLCL